MPAPLTLPRSFRLLAGAAVAATLLASILAALTAPASARAEGGTGAVAWGENTFMQLAPGYKNGHEERPVSVLGLPSNITSIGLGYHFDVALLGDGTVETWGGNAFGQLGNKTHAESGVPASIGLHGVKAVSAGGAHTLALLEGGTISNWGDNEFGELGNGVLNPMKRLNSSGLWESTMQGSGSPEPVAVPKLQNVVGIASGGSIEFALLSNGTVLAWGKNDHGQLGTGKVGPLICKTEIGEVPCSPTPEPVVLANGEPLRNVTAVAAGKEAAYALLSSGHVMGWGNNGRGEVGNGSSTDSHFAVEVKGLSNVVALSGGAPYALALLSDGHVMGWGGNAFGQLGVQANESCQTEPCLRTPRLIAGLEGVTSVSAGQAFTLALIRGKVWALGDNEPWGQLGVGGTLQTNSPKPIEGLPSVAVMTAGEQQGVAVLQSGSGPKPLFSVAPSAPSSLNVSWTVNTPVAALRWREFSTYKAGGPWSPMVYFRGIACSEAVPCTYSFHGLPAVPIEVQLLNYENLTIVGNRRTVATP